MHVLRAVCGTQGCEMFTKTSFCWLLLCKCCHSVCEQLSACPWQQGREQNSDSHSPGSAESSFWVSGASQGRKELHIPSSTCRESNLSYLGPRGLLVCQSCEDLLCKVPGSKGRLLDLLWYGKDRDPGWNSLVAVTSGAEPEALFQWQGNPDFPAE